MKRKTLAISLFAMLLCMNLYAQQVGKNLAETISENFISYHQKNHQLSTIEGLDGESGRLAWIAQLSPKGFILISASKDLRPVLAYSFESNWNTAGENGRIFQTLITSDIERRLSNVSATTKEMQSIRGEWEKLLSGSKVNERLEQWPPEGTTPTGGWLFTNWTQGSPYNQMCPIDGNTHQRSLAGCPATAMSMIVNCLMEINETLLFDSDDYYHSYGSGNQYWIDDDWANFGFPCFDTLNLYLDSVQANYAGHKPLTTPQISALTFACGVALKQVFTSSISGTFGIEQAAAAFQRFGFADSRLVYDSDTSLQRDLAENIKKGWPAQLGLLSPPPNQVGHNVVVDGYNTDEYYHFNFGWGGNSNGWYTMPPTNIPYNLTIIEGIVLDIEGDNPHVGIPELRPKNNFYLSWNPFDGVIQIEAHVEEGYSAKYFVSNIRGQVVDCGQMHLRKNEGAVYLPNFEYHGLHFFSIMDNKEKMHTIKFIR